MSGIHIDAKMLAGASIVLGLEYGYRMTFETWENDGDHDSVQMISGIKTEEDVQFYSALATSFASCHSARRGLGNEDHDSSVLDDLVADLLKVHTTISSDVRDRFTEMATNVGVVYQYLCDNILGHPVEYDYGFCRVMDSINIELVQPMVVPVTTVTL